MKENPDSLNTLIAPSLGITLIVKPGSVTDSEAPVAPTEPYDISRRAYLLQIHLWGGLLDEIPC